MSKPKKDDQSIKMMKAVHALQWKSYYAGAILFMGLALFVMILVLLWQGKFVQFFAGGTVEALLVGFGWKSAVDHFIPNKKSPQAS